MGQVISASPKLDRYEEGKMKYKVKKIEKKLDKISKGIEDYKLEEEKLDVLEQELVILNCKLESKKLGYDAEKVCKIDIRVDYGLEGKLKALEVEEQLNEMYNKINMYKENIEELKKKGEKT